MSNVHTSTNEMMASSIIFFVGTVVISVLLQLQQQQQQQQQHKREPHHHESYSVNTSSSSVPATVVGINRSLIDTINQMTKVQVYALRRKYFSKTLSISYTNTEPLMIMKGRGCYLYDVNENDHHNNYNDNSELRDCDHRTNVSTTTTTTHRRRRYLDTRNNVAHIGHCHPAYVTAIQQQMVQINTNTRYLHPMTTILAQQLLQTFPKPTTRRSNHSKYTRITGSNNNNDHELTKVFFCNSGSEANDLALRLTRAYFIIQQRRNCQRKVAATHSTSLSSSASASSLTADRQHQQPKSSTTSTTNPNSAKNDHPHVSVIVIDHAYHGHTIAALDVSPYKYQHSSEYSTTENNNCNNVDHVDSSHAGMKEEPSSPPLPHQSSFTRPSLQVHCVPCPNTYRGLYTNDDNNAGKLYAQHIEKICHRNKQRNENDDNNNCIGTVLMMESGMSVAGVIVPPNNYIQYAVQAVRDVDGLYIADEIQTGFGRYGTDCYWGFQYNNNKNVDSTNVSFTDPNPIPDIVTVGKGFGNGMPLAAVICNDKVNDAFEELMGHVEVFNTFGGNPVCTTAGYMVLNILEQEQLRQNATIVGAYLMDQLKLLQQQQHCYIGDIRGCGLFIGIEFVLDAITKVPATKLVSWLCSQLKDTYSILTSIDGPHNNVIVIKPPMVFSIDDAKYFISSLQNVIISDLLIFQSTYGCAILQESNNDDRTKKTDHTPT